MIALYLSAFANLDYLIAAYNIHNCGEINNESAPLDMSYIRSLGPNANAAVDEALAMPASINFSRRLSAVRLTLVEIQQAGFQRLAVLDLP